MKTLLSALLCATLVVGTTVTVCAAENTESACSHSTHIVEARWTEYVHEDDEEHTIYNWEEWYCLDCGEYRNELVGKATDAHVDSDNNHVCERCGGYAK